MTDPSENAVIHVVDDDASFRRSLVFLLESVEGGENWGRYSIIGLPARRTWTVHGHTLSTREFGEVVETRELADPLGEGRSHARAVQLVL